MSAAQGRPATDSFKMNGQSLPMPMNPPTSSAPADNPEPLQALSAAFAEMAAFG
jgi:hypothetical protein